MAMALNVLLEITIYSVILYGAILLFKKVFQKHISAILNYAVWGILILRLLLPVTIDSGLHFFVIPETFTQGTQSEESNNTDRFATVPEPMDSLPSSQYAAQNAANENTLNKVSDNMMNDNDVSTHNPVAWKISWQTILILLWITGTVGFLAYMSVLWLQLHSNIKKHGKKPPKHVLALVEACKTDLGIKAGIEVSMQGWLNSPALCASFRPKLLIPQSMLDKMDRQQLEFGIRHELTHYRRRDHLTHLLLAFLRCVYWFNPVVWLASRQIKTDMETACDVSVTARLENKDRTRYIHTMIDLSGDMDAQYILGMGLNNERKSMEKRVKGIFMKKKTKTSVKVVSILITCIMAMACFTTACQPTPEESVVVGKNDDNLDSIIAGTPAPTTDASSTQHNETWQEQLSGTNVTVNIDAEITLPQVAQFPVVEVDPKLYTEDDAWNIIKVFFQDSTVYDEPVLTKEVLEEQILSLKKELAEVQSGALDEDAESIQAEIDYYTELLQNAPSENNETQGLTDLIFKESTDGRDILKVSANIGSNNYPATLMIVNNTSNYNSGISFSNRLEAITTYPTTENNMEMTLDEAISKAQSTMSDLGMDDMILTESGIESSANEQGYVLHFIKGVNGIGISDYQSHMMSGQKEGEASVYAPSLSPEQVTIYINDTGLLKFHLSNALEMGEVINDNVEILSIDKVKDIFKEQVFYNYYATDDRPLTIDVDQIKLGYFIQSVKDQQGVFRAIPIWDFLANANAAEGDSYTYSVLTINAIDGSIINRDLGY